MKFLKFWNPIQFTVDKVYLIARKDSEPFRIHYEVFLKGMALAFVHVLLNNIIPEGKVAKVDVPYVLKDPVKKEENKEEEAVAVHRDATGFQIAPTHARVYIEAPAGVIGGPATTQQKQLVFVVDISGSMGSAYSQVVEAVKYMIETKPAKEPIFIVYGSSARLASPAEVQSAGNRYFTPAIIIIFRKLTNV